MILFEKVRWKNFLSTGNVFSEIDLQRSRTNLIVGHNGSGKSTILDALTFSLFGKPFRKISKSMLVNSVNKIEEKNKISPKCSKKHALEFHFWWFLNKILPQINPARLKQKRKKKEMKKIEEK